MSISCCGNQHSVQIDIPNQDSQMGKQEKETSKKMQFIHPMNYSLINFYMDSRDLQKADPYAYAFIKLRREEFIKLRDLKYERMSLSKEELKKQALPFMSFLSGLGLFCNFPIVGAGILTTSLVMGSGISISIGSSFFIISTACRLQESDADDIAISKATKEELKGALRFYKACQKADQIRDKVQDNSSGFFNRLLYSGKNSLKGRILSTSSDESWLPSLAMNPSWKDRIAKIEKKLQVQGEENTAIQAWEIELLVEIITRFRSQPQEAQV